MILKYATLAEPEWWNLKAQGLGEIDLLLQGLILRSNIDLNAV